MIISLEKIVPSEYSAPSKDAIRRQRESQLDLVRDLRRRIGQSRQPVLFHIPVQPKIEHLMSA